MTTILSPYIRLSKIYIHLAEMVNARRIGKGKWQARCPAHEDRSPSLGIAEGEDGRALVRCWAGCATADIVAALGLIMRDLFTGEPATSQQITALAAERKARDELERQQRESDRAARDRVWKLDHIRDALGAKLVRSPDDDKLAELFHALCDRSCAAEAELYPTHAELGGLPMEAPPETPAWIADALSDIGRNLSQGKGPLEAGPERIA